MPVAAIKTTVKVAGTSTAFTNEPTTELAADTVFQLNTAVRRVLDPNVAVLVEVDADGGGAGGYVAAAADTYTVDYLDGKITFATPLAAVALVRVSASYLPLLDVAEAESASLAVKRALLDKTVFHATDVHVKRMPGLKEATVEVGVLDDVNTDQDPGAGTQKLYDLAQAGTPVFVEIHPGAVGSKFRGWFLLDPNVEVSKDDQVKGRFTGQSTRIPGSGQTEGATFGWST